MTDRAEQTKARLAALDAVCEAIAHPARRQILMTIYFCGGEATAGYVAARFKHAWPTTTRHLQTLEAAGLLVHERRGRERVYRFVAERLEVLREWLGWFRPK